MPDARIEPRTLFLPWYHHQNTQSGDQHPNTSTSQHFKHTNISTPPTPPTMDIIDLTLDMDDDDVMDDVVHDNIAVAQAFMAVGMHGVMDDDVMDDDDEDSGNENSGNEDSGNETEDDDDPYYVCHDDTYVRALCNVWQDTGSLYQAIDVVNTNHGARILARDFTTLRYAIVSMASQVLSAGKDDFSLKYLERLEEYFTQSGSVMEDIRYKNVMRRFTFPILRDHKFVYPMNPVRLLNGRLLPEVWVHDNEGDICLDTGKNPCMCDGDIWHYENMQLMLRTLLACCMRKRYTRVSDVVQSHVYDFIQSDKVTYEYRLIASREVIVPQKKPQVPFYSPVVVKV